MPRPLSPTRLILFLVAISLVAALCSRLQGAEPTPAETPAASEATTTPDTDSPPPPEGGALQPPAQPQEEMTLWRILELGGWMMYILYGISFITIVLIAFYFLSLSTSNVVPAPFVAKVRDMLEKKRFSEASMYCAQHRSAVSSIVRAGLENASKKHVFVIEAMSGEGARQASRLWQQISYLADISVIAPMCGLLGTVTGMLWTFRSLAAARGMGAGQINALQLSNGIFQAMITTAAGLIIGIVAMGFYSVFRGMVQRLVVTLEETGDRVADLISRGD